MGYYTFIPTKLSPYDNLTALNNLLLQDTLTLVLSVLCLMCMKLFVHSRAMGILPYSAFLISSPHFVQLLSKFPAIYVK